MAKPNFNGLRVLALESRRATELATLISNFGGRPLIAPALREVPLESNTEALDFGMALIRGDFDIIIFLTGVGTRILVNVLERAHPRDQILGALARARVVARGPKPLAVLRELQVPVWVAAPEPNTWHELLAAVDERANEFPLRGARVAVQEYGVSNNDLLDALRQRGARVTRVPVYQWALPEDVEPLKNAAAALARGELDVALFTTSMQVTHLMEIARAMHLEEEVRRGLSRAIVASIGPTTSEELRRQNLPIDLEPSHPKMGVLVTETAERSAELLAAKRGGF
jgi:uroporphyrinogen-III synthase